MTRLHLLRLVTILLLISGATSASAHGVSLTEKVWIVTLDAFPPARVRASFDNRARGWHAQAEWDPAQPGPLAQSVRLRDGTPDSTDWVVSLWMEPIIGAAGGTNQSGYHLVLVPKSEALKTGSITVDFANLAESSARQAPRGGAADGGAPEPGNGGVKAAQHLTATWHIEESPSRRLAVVPSAPGAERSLDPLSGIAQELATVIAEIAVDRAKAGSAELLRSQLEQALCRELVWNDKLRTVLAGAPVATCSADDASCTQPLFPKTCEAVKHLRIVDLAASAKGLGEAFLSDALALGWGQLEQVLVRQVLKQSSIRLPLSRAFDDLTKSLPESGIRTNVEALGKALRSGSSAELDTALGRVLGDRFKILAVVNALEACGRADAGEADLQKAAASLANALADLADDRQTSKILRRLGRELGYTQPSYGNVSIALADLAGVLQKSNDDTSKSLGGVLKTIAKEMEDESKGERANPQVRKGLAKTTLAKANVAKAMRAARGQLDAADRVLAFGHTKSPLEMFFAVILSVDDFKKPLRAVLDDGALAKTRIDELNVALREARKAMDEGADANAVVSAFGRVGAVATEATAVLADATAIVKAIDGRLDGLAALRENRSRVLDVLERMARLSTGAKAQASLRKLANRFSRLPKDPTPADIDGLVKAVNDIAAQFPDAQPMLGGIAAALQKDASSRQLDLGALLSLFNLHSPTNKSNDAAWLDALSAVVAGKRSFALMAAQLGVPPEIVTILKGMSVYLPTIERILPIVQGTLAGRLTPDRAAQLVLSELANEKWADRVCGDNTDSSTACVSACGAEAVFAALEVCTSRSSGCAPADVTEVLTSTMLQGDGACQAVILDLKTRYPQAEQLILAGLEVLHPRPGTTPKVIARDVTTVAFALVRTGVCDGNEGTVACKDFDGTRDLTLAIFDDRPDLAIVAGAGVLERALDRMAEGNEDQKKALGKVSRVVGAVSAYAATYATGTKSDATSAKEQHEARKKAIEGLIDATTDRHGRGGDWVVSLGVNPGLFGGFQIGVRQSLYPGVPPQLSLPAGFAIDRLPSPKPGRSISCGGHFQLSFIDLGQFLAYASIKDTAKTEVAKPTWANAFLVGGQLGVLIGSPTNAVNLSLDFRYAPSLFSKSSDGTSGGAFRAGLTASYYVPLLDFN